ncbi:hypothetical protein, partial [Vibrio genomosp. F10]
SGVNYQLDLSQGDNEILTITRPSITSGSGYTLLFTPSGGVEVETGELAWDASTRDVSRAIEKALGLNYGQIMATERT